MKKFFGFVFALWSSGMWEGWEGGRWITFFLADYWYHSHYHHFNSAQSCRWLHCIPSQRAFFWFLLRPPQRCEAKTTIHSDGDNDQKHSFQTQQEQSHVVPCRSVECGIMIDYAIDYNVQLGAVEIICDYHCCCFAFSLSRCLRLLWAISTARDVFYTPDTADILYETYFPSFSFSPPSKVLFAFLLFRTMEWKFFSAPSNCVEGKDVAVIIEDIKY